MREGEPHCQVGRGRVAKQRCPPSLGVTAFNCLEEEMSGHASDYQHAHSAAQYATPHLSMCAQARPGLPARPALPQAQEQAAARARPQQAPRRRCWAARHS